MPGRAIVTRPLPHAVPFQPENSDPTPGNGLSATRVPTANRAWHSVPHWMPGGDEVTDPMPPPSSAIVNVAEPPTSVIAFGAGSVTHAWLPSGLMAMPVGPLTGTPGRTIAMAH